MSRAAKITLTASILATSAIVWGVHFLQQREADTMYLGVLRDDERRMQKMRKREEELQESLRKRAIYEKVQSVAQKAEPHDAPQ